MGRVPNNPPPRRTPIDAVDRAIVRALAENARIPNNALAEAVGIAPSTCLARVRALQGAGSSVGSGRRSIRRRSGSRSRR